MAPEQYRGQPATARSDQFSFCVALYEALFGVHPFHDGKAARRARRLRAMLRGDVTAPVTNQALDELRQAILRGLAAEPSDRYGSMSDLLTVLKRTAPRG